MEYLRVLSSDNKTAYYALTKRDLKYLILIEPKFKNLDLFGITEINSNTIYNVSKKFITRLPLNLPSLIEDLDIKKIIPMIPPHWTNEDKLDMVKSFSSKYLNEKIYVGKRTSLLTKEEGNELYQYIVHCRYNEVSKLTLDHFNGFILIDSNSNLDDLQDFKNLVRFSPIDTLARFITISIFRPYVLEYVSRIIDQKIKEFKSIIRKFQSEKERLIELNNDFSEQST